MPSYHLAHFACDVTPPVGHPLCGGWIEAVRGVDDPLRALGVILLGFGSPVVLCAVDWCGIRNEANRKWRQALAEATHTVPENVALHSVHQHDAPFADIDAERFVAAVPGAPNSLDLKFLASVIERTATAAKQSLAETKEVTHIGWGQARVDQVASNRRVLGAEGRVKYTRTSATKDEQIRAAPEGLIDPYLKTVSFWNGAEAIAALHYYATHPMSYYGNGRVSSDFCGLARSKWQSANPRVFQVYFTGCAGNVTAGKYNDGATANRAILRDRVASAMCSAWQSTKRQPARYWEWRVQNVRLPARTESSFSAAESRKILADPQQAPARRGNAAFQLSWLERINRSIDFSCLDLGLALILHLPGEPFVEYQLRAQAIARDRFVCVAGYGDGGPGYIPTARAYWEGGYEPTVALAAPESEKILDDTIAKLVRGRGS